MNEKREKICAVIVAAGSGKRMGTDIPKQYLKIGKRCVLSYTISAFQSNSNIDSIVLVVSHDYTGFVKKLCVEEGFTKVIAVCEGGLERTNSVYNGLCACPDDTGFVMIHDGARPLVDDRIINSCKDLLLSGISCAPGAKVKDTIKICDGKLNIISTADRECMYSIQTPQCFKLASVLEAYKDVIEKNVIFTDDCMLLEGKEKIKIIPDCGENIKITTPEDLFVAETILKKRGIL